MHLTLVRHGQAANPVKYSADEKRPLTALGHQQAEQTAIFLQKNIQPDIFVVSPLLRAQETLLHIQHYFPNVPILECNAIKPDDEAKVAVQWLSQLPYQNIVVVCHMNVVAYIEQILTVEPIHSFSLAEARCYEQEWIGAGLSTCKKTFVPNV